MAILRLQTESERDFATDGGPQCWWARERTSNPKLGYGHALVDLGRLATRDAVDVARRVDYYLHKRPKSRE